MQPPTPAESTGPLLRLVLGDQLNPRHSWFERVDPHVVHVLMEVRSETDYVRHHAQKVIAIFAALRDFAQQLKAAGHRVRYIAIDDASNRHTVCDNLQALVQHYGASAVEYQQPDEWRLDQQLQQWAAQADVPVRAVDSKHFFTERDAVQRLFAGKKQWLMESFYRQQRRLHRVLLREHLDRRGAARHARAMNLRRGAPGPADFYDACPHCRHRTPQIEVTHQAIALSLGTRREAVTHACQSLPGLRPGRGHLEITDRASLEKHSCECYFLQKEAHPGQMDLPFRALVQS